MKIGTLRISVVKIGEHGKRGKHRKTGSLKAFSAHFRLFRVQISPRKPVRATGQAGNSQKA
jgi:hypothetical protein